MNTAPDPVLKWLEEVNALSLILWIGAAITLITAAFRLAKRAIPALKKLIALSESLEKLPAWMESTDKKLGELRHEVFPNGGGSMRDDIQTISLQIEQLQAHDEKDFQRLEELEDTITRRLEARDAAQTAPIIIPPTNPKETP